MALSISVASDLANACLTFYVRGGTLFQTQQDRPLLRALNSNKKTFPGGKDNVSLPVQGAFMSDSTFGAGYNEGDTLTFAQAANVLRAAVAWKEMHAGLVITWTELKKDAVTVNDDAQTSEHSEAELTQLMSILENRIGDYMESWSRYLNTTFWADGSSDTKAIPGIQSLLYATNSDVGTTMGLNRATYSWWRNRTNAIAGVAGDITPSAANQNLSRTLRKELIQLQRYGGKPSVALVGSDFLDGLFLEVQEKGVYTQSGFARTDTDVGITGISMNGLGTFQYDPTLDTLGLSKYAYIIDPRRLVLYPMQGEENKVGKPTRPYDQAVYLQSTFYTGALTCNQLNACGVYKVA